MNEVIEKQKKSEVLAEKIAKMSYGDIILHTEIADIIEEKYPSAKYNSEVQKARKILLKKHAKTIENIVGDGYRIVDPDSFIDVSMKHYKRGFKEMRKGVDTLNYAPVKDMSEEGRNTYRRMHDRAIALDAAMNGVKVELRQLGRKRSQALLESINKR